MSRLEENKEIIEETIKRAADKSPVTYQEMMTFQTDAIVNVLADISKSLAILADRAEKEQTLDNIEEVYLNLMRIQAEKESGPKWIPVTERLPKPGEYDGDVDKYYLVQHESGDMTVARYTHCEYGEYWEQIFTGRPIAGEIVAWMLLPEEYKVESEEEE